MRTILDLWKRSERLWPSKIALMAQGERITYRELGLKIRAVAEGLDDRWNVRSGDVVALYAPNSVEFVVSYFAITALGAIVQPIDDRLDVNEVEFVLGDSGAGHMIVHRAFWPRLEKVSETARPSRVLLAGLRDERAEFFEGWMDLYSGSGWNVKFSPSSSDTAELMYTSGTTGRAKGVLRSHRNVLSACRNAINAFGYRSDDIIAVVMPMSHSSALVSQMLPLISVGGSLLLVERFEAKGLLRDMKDRGVTCMRAVRAMFVMLMAHEEFSEARLPSLRLLTNSSASIDRQTCEKLKQRFPRIELANSYGLTEASTSSVLSDILSAEDPDCIGVPVSGVEIRVVGEDGRRLEGFEEGELCIRGPHVFSGYYKRPKETAAAFSDDGWFRTGDVGHQGACGRYYLHGRRDDMINCGGRKFAPLEVENCILELPDVAEAAVVATPHQALGEVSKAFVVPQHGTSVHPKDVVRHCAKRLPSHKVPFFVEIADALPKSSVGKVLRQELRTAEEA